ncbi:MAG TPA: nodulation protein NfeD [Steroidobacteraceae bacterium]|jgi:membrane-bound serine protease (ClpP class)|nr:nodulation protein NfeD [Steroidobacteraceae bacterium]
MRLASHPFLTALLLIGAAAAGDTATIAPAAAVTEPGGTVTVLEIKGPIGPATSHYVVRGLEAAQAAGSRLVVIEMDTPGGLDTSMRDIIRAILASPIPVVSYVSPSGARAASAGTYILYASHIAAMAPATNLGAATPVSIGGEGEPAPAPAPTPTPPSPPVKGATPSAGAGDTTPPPPENPPGSAMERKVVNDAAAYIRGLAELRGRNVEWAEHAVRGAASLSANAALEQKVIDVIATDLPDLLKRIDGREVRVQDRTVKLATLNLAVQQVKPDWRTELLAVITNPTVAYGLMLIGIWGLLLEGYNPGAVLPGVAGSICLLIALFAFQILSVNYAGLALVVLGTAMIVAEFFFPTYGSLGAGGLIAFIVGSLILFDTDVPGLSVGRPLIFALATVGAIVIAGIVYLATRAMRHPVATGTAGMIGASAEVFEDFTGKGRVRYAGELWNARSKGALRAGEQARIVRVEGLTLWVEPQ